MAILIKRAHPVHLRRFHLLRSLLHDRKFILSAISGLIIITLAIASIIRAPQIRAALRNTVMSTSYQLATSGEHTGWHTYTDRTDRFQADFPCFAYTNPQPHASASPFGPLSLRSTACLYSVGSSNESFEVDVSPLSYPPDQDGQTAILQQLAISRDGADANVSATTLNGATALAETLSGDNGRRYYTVGGNNLYIITYTRPANAANYGSRFVNSFRALRQ